MVSQGYLCSLYECHRPTSTWLSISLSIVSHPGALGALHLVRPLLRVHMCLWDCLREGGEVM